MKTDLSEGQIDAYRNNGFIIIENFLDPVELETWRQHVDAAVKQRGEHKLANSDWLAGDTYYDNVFTQRINLWMDHDGMRGLILDNRLGQMAAILAGVDGIRIWHDQTLIKEAWANPTAWHLDNPYWSFSSRDAISLWVALDDATYHNGCLYFLPGTHKEDIYDNSSIGQNMADLMRIYPAWAQRRAIPAPMRAGDCSFHNGLTAHGAHANMTPDSRRAMTCAYMPDGETFNGTKNVLPEDYLIGLKVGDTLDNDLLNPLIYHPQKECVSA